MLSLTYRDDSHDSFIGPRRTNFGIFGAAAVLGLTFALGCTAGTKPNTTGAGGQNPITGIGGAAGKPVSVTGFGGGIGIGGSIGLGGSTPNPDAKACQEYAVEFKPKTPTVVILVDRSTSMFPCLGSSDTRTFCADHANTSWDKERVSMLQVIQSLQAGVRFGIVTYMGINGGTCPTLNKVAPALNNYQAISTFYDGLPWPSNQKNDKWETPTAAALASVGADLMADTSTDGDKYILLVTDGAPDYCNDVIPMCAADDVIGKMQALNAAGITTIVFGLKAPVNDLPTPTLQAFANAGAGEDTLPTIPTTLDITAIWDQCQANGDSAAWKAAIVEKYPECGVAATANTCRGKTLGTYAAASGPSHPYTPDASNQTELVQQLGAALAGVKSCTFDLGGHVMVNTQRLGEAVIKIDGAVIPLDPSSGNGWNMNTPTQLELYGSACDTWRAPTATDIHFGFPCDIIVD
jgi:hypothetical protein